MSKKTRYYCECSVVTWATRKPETRVVTYHNFAKKLEEQFFLQAKIVVTITMESGDEKVIVEGESSAIGDGIGSQKPNLFSDARRRLRTLWFNFQALIISDICGAVSLKTFMQAFKIKALGYYFIDSE